jgi:ubiquinone/menaquinone biosynthesis C-methylase UbiE
MGETAARTNTHYIIRGGAEGRERLRIIARVMQPTTRALLQRCGIRPAMRCLDVGCGGGDLAFDLARMVSPLGKVVATDIDQAKLEIARDEAARQRLSNVEFRLADIITEDPENDFALVHARFLLTHLPDPTRALTCIWKALRPGGIVVIEDIDFRGHFCHPDCPAFWRYVDLYTRTVAKRGGDANIGPRLPALLAESGFENVQMNVAQPAGATGEVKLIAAITMENIADAVVAEGLASAAEITEIVTELYEFAGAPGTVMSIPRVIEAWGTKSERQQQP